MLLFLWAVRFARIHDKLALDSIALQCAVKHLALRQRIGSIILTVKQHRRRANVLDVSHGRALSEAIRLFVRKPVEPLVVRRVVFSAELSREITHARARDRSLESI